MKIGLRILLGYFLIVALAALLLGRVFVQEVKPEKVVGGTANQVRGQVTDLIGGK